MTRKPAIKPAFAAIPSLATAQISLENATRELTAAQSNFIKAQERLSVAEEEHNRSTLALMNEVTVIRGQNRVNPVALK